MTTRDEVLSVAARIVAAQCGAGFNVSIRESVNTAIDLIAEVDKRFPSREPDTETNKPHYFDGDTCEYCGLSVEQIVNLTTCYSP